MMPPYIIGRLQQEIPTGYVLSNVLEPVEDQSADSGFRIDERTTFDVVSRTYVWRVEMMGQNRPDIMGTQQYIEGMSGGLG
jgi:hypothetical protein